MLNPIKLVIRRVHERLALWLELAPPRSKMEGGVCVDPYCRWPYHTHELFGGKR